jgi:hypothetical protein
MVLDKEETNEKLPPNEILGWKFFIADFQRMGAYA